MPAKKTKNMKEIAGANISWVLYVMYMFHMWNVSLNKFEFCCLHEGEDIPDDEDAKSASFIYEGEVYTITSPLDLVNRAALKKKGPKPAVLNVLRAIVRRTVTKRFDTAKVTSEQTIENQDGACQYRS